MTIRSFGKYRVTRLVGQGGMAEVYQAVDPDLERSVAIKVIRPHLTAGEGFGDRFQREAKLVGSLRQSNIVQIYDFDVVDGSPYMVMEYLHGGTLKERLAQHRAAGTTMPLDEVARLVERLAAALDYAHARGAIHRDLKPANIMFTAQNEPVVTDFGIAKILGQAGQHSMTGLVVGTPAYMSPEQAGAQSVDARSDVYSLGIILYEMAVGRVPFDGDSLATVMMQHVTQSPPLPRQFNPRLPEPVQAVILKALAKDPAERFASAGQLAQALRAAVNARAPDTTRDMSGLADASTMMPGAQTSMAAASGAAAPSVRPGPSAPQPARVVADAVPQAVVVKASSRRWLILAGVLGVLMAAAAGALAVAPGLLPGYRAVTTGASLRFRDGPTRPNDTAQVIIPGAATAAPGTQYEAWLVDSQRENRESIGTLSAGDNAERNFADPSGRNLLAQFDGVEITVEPSPDPNRLPSQTVFMRGRLPPQALVHIRHLLVSRPDAPASIGFAAGLLDQAKILKQLSKSLQADSKSPGTMKRIAESMVNLIEGRGGKNFGDLDGDGNASVSGDGFGLQPNGPDAGYIQGTMEHARLAAEQTDATAGIRLHAGHVRVAAQNVGEWVALLRNLALEIANGRGQPNEETVGEIVALANKIHDGVDVDRDEQVEPIAGEGGALVAYQHAQFMADIPLSAP